MAIPVWPPLKLSLKSQLWMRKDIQICSGHVEARTGREGDKGQVEEQKTKIRRDLGDQDARMIRDQVKSSV